MKISKEEKIILLKSARESICSIFSNEKLPFIDLEKHPLFTQKCGVFVTLTINDQLRGCIGYIISDKPLFTTLCEVSIQSAINDPRFPKLTEDEFPQIKIEISLLSEPFKLNNYAEIEIGKHGLILEENGGRALLLPQVPIEHNMNKEEYLSALCNKGNFKHNFWKEKLLNIKMFTATVFSEKEFEK